MIDLRDLARRVDAAFPRSPQGTREDPFTLIVPEQIEPICEEASIREGDIVRLPQGFFRLIFSRYIPESFDV